MNSALAKVAGVAALVFVCMSVISYASVNKWDLGEVTQDGLKSLITLGLAYIALHLKPSQVLGALLVTATMLAGAGECEAGPLFGRFARQQSSACANGQCAAQPAQAKAAAAAPTPQPAPQAAPQAPVAKQDVFDLRTPEQKRIWLEHDLRDGGASARRDAEYWERVLPQTPLTRAFAQKDSARVAAVEKALAERKAKAK